MQAFILEESPLLVKMPIFSIIFYDPDSILS
jgi:hypothetical protein